jgi:hypothetical protein
MRYKGEGEVALSAFRDVSGAFEKTEFVFIRSASERRQNYPETVEWIVNT